jgi:hypothetical protein
MKSIFLFILLTIAAQVAAQDGIVALARYDGINKPTLKTRPSLPEFKGGFAGLRDSFQRQFDYTNALIAHAITHDKPREGLIGFAVNSFGHVFDIQIIDSTSSVTDAEAVRVLSNLKGFYDDTTTKRFSVTFDPFPDWRWEDEREKLRYQKEFGMRDKIANTSAAELEKLVDPQRRVIAVGIWMGQTSTTPKLTAYLRNMGQFGFIIERTKRKWYASGHFQIKWGTLRRDFEAKDYYWQRDTSFTIGGLGLNFGRQIVHTSKFILTPYVGFDVQGLSIVSSDGSAPDDSPTLTFVLPSAGLLLDYKFHQRGDYAWGYSSLNTAFLRFRLAVNAANFGKPRQGALIDLGIGFGFFQRALKK